jgi:hypothetical protein
MMNWYEICEQRYPKNHMTLEQLSQCLKLKLINKKQFDKIIKLRG